MKKILLSVLVLTLVFASCAKKVTMKQQDVTVTFMMGSVEKKDAGSAQWQKLALRDKLTKGQMIKTAGKSQCDLQLSASALFRIKSDSVVEIKNLFIDPKTGVEKTALSIQEGSILSKINKLKKDSSMNIETPTAVAGVRGTEFFVAVDKGQNTTVAVQEGKVSMKPTPVISEADMKKASSEMKEAVKEIDILPAQQVVIKQETVQKIETAFKQDLGGTGGEKAKEEVQTLIKSIKTETVAPNIKTELKIEFKNMIIESIDKETSQEKNVQPEKKNPGTVLWQKKVSESIKNDLAGDQNGLYAAASDGTIQCLGFGSEKKWEYKITSAISGSPALSGSALYIGANDGTLYAISKNNGQLLWKKNAGTLVYSKPAVFKEKIYTGSSDGVLTAFNNADGSTLWTYKAPAGIYSTPAPSDDSIVFGCEDNNIYCLNASGTLKWQYKTEGRIVKSSPVIFGSTVFAAGYDGYLYCLNIQNGSLVWKFQTKSKIISTPCVASDRVLFASTDGNLYCVKISDGKLLWKNSLGGKPEASPVLKDSTVYIGDDNGNILAFSVMNGAKLWQGKSSGRISSGVIIAGQNVYAVSEDGVFSGMAR